MKLRGIHQVLFPIQLRLPIRNTVNELPGKERVNVEPGNCSGTLLGATFVGSANEFSSAGLSEESTKAVAEAAKFFAPLSATSVSSTPAAVLTTFRMMSRSEEH